MNLAKRPPASRRLLGDTRREAVEALHHAASKRRRLADADDDPLEDTAHTLGDDDAAVFADAIYEQDDVEADAVYAAVDSRMESRRQKHREARLQRDLRDYRRANPTIRQQFADLKTQLGGVGAAEWAAIPDIGDYSVKKQKFQKFTPAPDSLLERARLETAVVASEPAAYGTATDLASISAGRTSVLGQKLDRAGDALAAAQNVDASGYLAEMAGVRVSTDSEIGDIKKARLLLKSVTSTNPSHAPGWIAAARLEENAGKMAVGRQLILEGCRRCPREEDVWIEAARLHPKDTGRRVLARGVRTVPRSAKVWLQAATLEDDSSSKRRVLRKALEIIPRNSILWKAAVELEEPSGARILLSRAVECVPSAKELWLALARLEPYENAKETLQRAQKAIPTDPMICITAAQLEETQNGASSAEIQRIVQRGVESLSKTTDEVKRADWLNIAQEADIAGYPGTVMCIIESCIDLGIAEGDCEAVWVKDADELEKRGCKACARSVYKRLTRTFSARTDLWLRWASFERRLENQSELENVLSEAVQYSPNAELLWLMLAKDKWKTGGADEGREVLRRAFEANPNSQAIRLAAAKVESETKNFEKARSLLRGARQQAPSAQVYMKSALLERQLAQRAAERKLLEDGLTAYPKAEKLWLMLAQWYERASDTDKVENLGIASVATAPPSGIHALSSAPLVYAKGVQNCGTCAALWIGYARLEERLSSVSKARAILQRGRERCKGSEQLDMLWRECVYLEIRHGQQAAGLSLLARALQECRHSGRLWALAVAAESRPGQKGRSVDAIKQCPGDAAVVLEVAKYIWRGGRVAKARAWMRRSAELDADWGDAWATWSALEREQGDEDAVREVERMAVAAEPRHGDLWTAVSKAKAGEGLDVAEVLRLVTRLVTKDTNVTGLYDV